MDECKPLAWGEDPAPDADGESARALLAAAKGKGRKIPTSEVDSDFKPKPGSIGAMKPLRAGAYTRPLLSST